LSTVSATYLYIREAESRGREPMPLMKLRGLITKAEVCSTAPRQIDLHATAPDYRPSTRSHRVLLSIILTTDQKAKVQIRMAAHKRSSTR
jgi:hypothetical protein